MMVFLLAFAPCLALAQDFALAIYGGRLTRKKWEGTIAPTLSASWPMTAVRMRFARGFNTDFNSSPSLFLFFRPGSAFWCYLKSSTNIQEPVYW